MDETKEYTVKVTLPIEIEYLVEGYPDEEAAMQRAKEYLQEDIREKFFLLNYDLLDLIKAEVTEIDGVQVKKENIK